MQDIAVAKISPSPYQSRRVFDEEGIARLAQSLERHGLLQAVVVRPNGKKGHYELIAGERRLRAARSLKWKTVRAVVREDLDDESALELCLIENLQREDLSPLEEGEAYAALLETGLTLATIAEKVSRSVGHISKRARLVRISPEVRERCEDPEDKASVLSAGHLELLAEIDPEVQPELLKEALHWNVPTVGELSDLIAQSTAELAKAPWALDDESLGCQACDLCPSRSDRVAALGADQDPRKARCLNRGCWATKSEAFGLASLARVRESRDSEALAIVGNGFQPEWRAGANGDGHFVGDEEVLRQWDFERVKKSTKGARPAVVVAGAGLGGTVWVKVRRQRTIGGTDSKPKKASLAERKAAKQRARMRDARDLAMEFLIQEAPTPSDEQLVVLVAEFGTEGWGGRELPGSLVEEVNQGGDVMEKVRQVAWNTRVAPRLLEVTKIHNLGGAEKAWQLVCGICEVLSIDSAPFLVEATEALPDPATWAKEEAAEKAAKAKAKATKPKKTPARPKTKSTKAKGTTPATKTPRRRSAAKAKTTKRSKSAATVH